METQTHSDKNEIVLTFENARLYHEYLQGRITRQEWLAELRKWRKKLREQCSIQVPEEEHDPDACH